LAQRRIDKQWIYRWYVHLGPNLRCHICSNVGSNISADFCCNSCSDLSSINRWNGDWHWHRYFTLTRRSVGISGDWDSGHLKPWTKQWDRNRVGYRHRIWYSN
jgi:hypothetical protein